jgi:hypothetical protein
MVSSGPVGDGRAVLFFRTLDFSAIPGENRPSAKDGRIKNE